MNTPMNSLDYERYLWVQVFVQTLEKEGPQPQVEKMAAEVADKAVVQYRERYGTEQAEKARA